MWRTLQREHVARASARAGPFGGPFQYLPDWVSGKRAAVGFSRQGAISLRRRYKMRLVQLAGPDGRRVALVEEPRLRLLEDCRSVYDLASEGLHEGAALTEGIARRKSDELVDYDAVYAGTPAWRICPSADVPSEPARCLVSGTGLTHKASARNRDAMHAGAQAVTDSTRMYQSGVEGGKPALGEAGIAPEWFYKGCGTVLRAHNEPLIVPEFAEDGGEEPEVAGVYLIDAHGAPRRIGFTAGNEFSDHVLERNPRSEEHTSELQSLRH